MLALAAKVDYAVDPESTFPRHYSGAVEIVTCDGRRLSRRENVNRGSSERPLTIAAIEEKFLENAQRVIPKARAGAVRDAILNIDSSDDVTAVTRELS